MVIHYLPVRASTLANFGCLQILHSFLLAQLTLPHLSMNNNQWMREYISYTVLFLNIIMKLKGLPLQYNIT